MDVSASSDRRRFFPLLLAVLAVYVVLASIYAVHLQRNMDEFGTAVIVQNLATPYVTYCPPKTVLSYYVVKPAIALVRDAWDALTAARLLMMALTTLVLGAVAAVMRRWLSMPSILISLVTLELMSNFAERQIEMRADTVSTLFGLLALIALMSERPLVAGILAMTSVLATQKGIYFAFSGGFAISGAVVYRRSKAEAMRWLRYVGGMVIPVVAYFGFFASLTSLQHVFDCSFGKRNVNVSIALINVYTIRWPYWRQAMERNPLFFALAAFGLAFLAVRWLRREVTTGEMYLAPFAFALTACSVWHKQPWPYFFVNLAPTLFVVNAFAIEFISKRVIERSTRLALIGVFVLAGVLFPLTRLRTTLRQTSDYQEATFRVAQQLLGPGETYIDGVGFLFNRKQSTGILDWLEKWRLEAVNAMSPAEQARLIAGVDNAPTKLIMWNYRTASLPPRMRNALFARFAQVYGNIYLYAPTLRPGPFRLSYDGDYRVIAPAGAVKIDGTTVGDRSVVTLRKGEHMLDGSTARLQLLPPPNIVADAQYNREEDPYRNIYGY